MATKAANGKGKVGKMDFTPIDKFDVDEIVPDAPEGEYKAVSKVKLLKTQKDGYPMIVVEWTIKDAADKENKAAKGASVSDFITFFPASEGRRGNMGKRKLKEICELLDVDADVLPKQLKSKKDLDPLLKALDKKTATIFVQHQERDGDTRANVVYADPFAEDEEEEEEEEEDEEEDEDEEESDDSDDEDEDEDEDESEDEDEDEDDEDDEEEAPKKPAKKAAAKKGKK